jgi:hypothetical protein
MSRYVTNFESLLLKEFPSNDMTKPLNAIIGVAIFFCQFSFTKKKGSQLTATLWDLHSISSRASVPRRHGLFTRPAHQ